MDYFTPYQLALMLLEAVRQLNLTYLLAVLKEAHNTCSDSDLRWIFKVAKLDLSPEERAWLKRSLAPQEA